MKKTLLLLSLCFISPCIQASSLSPIPAETSADSLYGSISLWNREHQLYQTEKTTDRMLVNGYIRRIEPQELAEGSVATALRCYSIPIYLKQLIFNFYFYVEPSSEIKKLWEDMFLEKDTSDLKKNKTIDTIGYLARKYSIVDMEFNNTTALVESIRALTESEAEKKKKELVIQKLIDMGADVNKTKKDGEAPLHTASRLRWVQAIEMLLENGADINKKTKIEGDTSLILAVGAGWPSVVKKLLEYGARIDLKNNVGKDVFDIVEESIKNYDDLSDNDIRDLLNESKQQRTASSTPPTLGL